MPAIQRPVQESTQLAIHPHLGMQHMRFNLCKRYMCARSDMCYSVGWWLRDSPDTHDSCLVWLEVQQRQIWFRTARLTLQCSLQLSSDVPLSEQEQCFEQPEQIPAVKHDSMPHESLYETQSQMVT